MTAEPRYRRDHGAWQCHLAEGNTKQARKRVGADTLLRDSQGRLLLGDPDYKPDWDLPRGMIEANEPPIAGLIRELKEELDLDLQPDRPTLACIDSVSPHGPWDDSLMLTFTATQLRPDEIATIQPDHTELTRYAFVTPAETEHRLRPTCGSDCRPHSPPPTPTKSPTSTMATPPSPGTPRRHRDIPFKRQNECRHTSGTLGVSARRNGSHASGAAHPLNRYGQLDTADRPEFSGPDDALRTVRCHLHHGQIRPALLRRFLPPPTLANLPKSPRPKPKIDQKYVDELRSEVTRPERQVAELRFANIQLRAALVQAAALTPARTDFVYQRIAAHPRWRGQACVALCLREALRAVSLPRLRAER